MAVLGGIQGNREALGAVLAALHARGITRVACVGDIVGYNADPDECAALLRERRAPAIAGDHDLIAARRMGLEACGNDAAYALRRTRRALAAETVAYLEALPLWREIAPGVALAHASALKNAGFRFCFFRGQEQEILEADGMTFVSPGSVDAARKGRKLAECAIFDGEAVEFLRVPYDAASSECKAAALGYRIPRWMNGAYSARKRLSRLPHRLAAMSSAALRWPSTFRSSGTN